ncbi:hypothetical protein L9F63_000475, partial [Diploptera punctata]
TKTRYRQDRKRSDSKDRRSSSSKSKSKSAKESSRSDSKEREKKDMKDDKGEDEAFDPTNLDKYTNTDVTHCKYCKNAKLTKYVKLTYHLKCGGEKIIGKNEEASHMKTFLISITANYKQS